jgi:hypothetical protein
MERVRVGEAALLMYAAATYVPQSIFHALNEEALTERFRIDPGMQPLALFIVAFLLLALLLNELLPRVRTGNGRLARIMAHVFESPANILLGVLLIVLAANFYATEGISFRQTGEHLSEAGAAVQLLMLCKPYVYAWTVYHLVRIIRGRNLGNARARCVGVLFLASLVLSITGAFDVIPLVWCAAFVTCSSRRVRAIFLIMRPRRPLWQRLALLILGIPAAAAVVATMIWLGYANKMGGEQTLELFRRIGVEEIAEQVMVRASTSYASTVSFAEHNLANASLYESALRVPLENVPYRLSLVFGAPQPRPEVTQISRLNYLNYENDTHLERAGASPGLVSSGFFAAPFPLGFVLMAMYVTVILRIVNLAFADLRYRPRVTLVFMVVCFIYPFFESPVDYLVFVDPSIMQLLLVLSAFAAAATRVRQPAHVARSPVSVPLATSAHADSSVH